MSEHDAIIIGCIGAYLVFCVAIGLWAMGRTHDSRDFFAAGRSLGPLVTSVAVFSSMMSGFGFVGGPGLVYLMGMSSVWIVLTTVTGYTLAFVLLAKPMRMLAELYDAISLPDLVAVRYSSETARLLTAITIVLGVMGFLASQILAMGNVLEQILARADLFGSPGIATCTIVAASFLILYCTTGGIIAGVYTDLVQGIIMVVAGVLVFLTAQGSFEGGFSGMSTTLLADDPESIGTWGSLGMIGCLSWFLLFLLGTAGQPHVITKFMMMRRLSDVRWTLPMALAGHMFSALLWVSIGLSMRALVLNGDLPALASPDAASPIFLYQYAYPALAGLVFAGLFAAIMSTSDSFLNIAAAAVVHDLPRALFGRTLGNELFWARVATVGVALLATGFALFSHFQNARLVALLAVFGGATFAGALVPAVAIGFRWRRATPAAACWAIATSLTLNLGFEVLGIDLPYGIQPGLVALLASLLLFFTLSFAQPAPKVVDDVEAILDA
jgi:Na+/proline symporter